jgi:hypothetical protein
MTYKHKNRCRPNGACSNCQRHEEPQGQKLKERFNFNFQTRNKTKLCDSKIKTQEHKMCKKNVKTNFYNVHICKHEGRCKVEWFAL